MVWQRMMNLMSMRTVTAFSVHDLRGSSADDDNDNDDGFVLRRKMQSGGLYNKIRGGLKLQIKEAWSVNCCATALREDKKLVSFNKYNTDRPPKLKVTRGDDGLKVRVSKICDV